MGLPSPWHQFLPSSVSSYSYSGTLEESPGLAEGATEVNKGVGDRTNGMVALGRQQQEEGELETNSNSSILPLPGFGECRGHPTGDKEDTQST